jgi:phosphoribosylglycinamide formyltransferase-1
VTARLGILISGGGTTMLNLHRYISEGRLDAEIAVVISSKSKAKGVQRARDLGYPVEVVVRRKFDSDEAFSTAINQHLVAAKIDLVCLAGFLKLYLPGPSYRGRTLNIHPSLIPAFCGHGYYGMKVHEAVWQRGCRVSGCTVHLVNDQYDEGPILVQKVVEINPEDTPEDIQKKVAEKENEAYPEAIRMMIEDRVRIENSRMVSSVPLSQ